MDTGGTFTDALFETPDGHQFRGKVLSSGNLRCRVLAVSEDRIRVSPLPPGLLGFIAGKTILCRGKRAGHIHAASADILHIEAIGATLAADDIIEIELQMEAPVQALHCYAAEALEGEQPVHFRLGTTKGTNCLLEGKGAPVALFLSAGFADLLLIDNQKRPDLFARGICRPAPMYRSVHAIAGRIDSSGKELQPLDTSALDAAALAARRAGSTVAAVCFLHSWKNPAHEELALEILSRRGFAEVSISAQVAARIHYLHRAQTTTVNATLEPVLRGYFDRVQAVLGDNRFQIMSSAGGLLERCRFRAVDSLVSGPAGGVMGAAAAAAQLGWERFISLDMGGTSTDVARSGDAGRLCDSISVAGVRVLVPAMRIETVAAGGGSVCGGDCDALKVGPESAGAQPGPAAYGAGGPLTLTDIHLLLGRADASSWSIPVDIHAAFRALQRFATSIATADLTRVAEGFLEIATERMAQAIEVVTARDGENPADYGLVVFGGAGGLHACRIAALLGIRKILFPPDAGLLSARGIHYSVAEAVREAEILQPLHAVAAGIADCIDALIHAATEELVAAGHPLALLGSAEITVFVRLQGQEQALPIEWIGSAAGLADCFRQQFDATFGFYPEAAQLELVRIRARVAERVPLPDPETFPPAKRVPIPLAVLQPLLKPDTPAIPVYQREHLLDGDCFAGPAVINDPFGTCFVEHGWRAMVGSYGSVVLQPIGEFAAASGAPDSVAAGGDLVQTTLVRNRLFSLVEEMGVQLQRTALSTNIRERLDFSCALLHRDGYLLLNAPHIPVHLGAMGTCLRAVLEQFQFRPGDVLITNHPAFGGSHLPDVTLICGAFDAQGQIIAYLANRAHHAEIGGKAPGSMPVDAGSLLEEGVVIAPQWLLRDGKDCFQRIEALLRESPYPSRSPRENRIDLEAQLASLQSGLRRMQLLCDALTADRLRAHLDQLYHAAATAMQRKLQELPPRSGTALEHMDDGTAVRIHWAHDSDSLRFDFSGTAPLHCGNLNATPAIVRSAILYALRLLLDADLPLNEGILDRVHIHLPTCFLNPEFSPDPAACPAVVGGNTETSQRIVDALLRSWGIMAGGPATMNNLLFGNDQFGFYETIGSGAAGGPGFQGASAVHVHMTNTAITDPEILEHRYPVRCILFAVRSGSGAKGRFAGGDGIIREIQFLQAVEVCLLTQSRAQAPKGLCGGSNGTAGFQYLLRNNGLRVYLPPLAQISANPGDAIHIETPGGAASGSCKAIV